MKILFLSLSLWISCKTPVINPGKHTPGNCIPGDSLVPLAKPWYKASIHYGFFLTQDSLEAFWIPAPGNPKQAIKKYYLIDSHFIHVPQ